MFLEKANERYDFLTNEINNKKVLIDINSKVIINKIKEKNGIVHCSLSIPQTDNNKNEKIMNTIFRLEMYASDYHVSYSILDIKNVKGFATLNVSFKL